jgi:hypothetical protein
MEKKNDVDEKLIKWNAIFEELLIDVNALVKDLLENINYIAIVGALLILLGGAAVSIAILRGLGTKYIAYSVIIFSICLANGIIHLQKWHKLKIRYNRLQSLQKEMGSN